MAYHFFPDPMSVDPREYGLICRVFYHDEYLTNYSSVFFRGVVTMEEANSGLDGTQYVSLT